MICEICRDEGFLAQKAEAAGAEDLGTAQDLLDTLIAHKDGCVGMAVKPALCASAKLRTVSGDCK